MKTVNDNFWTEELESQHINVGFTQAFIDNVLGECFHILPADTRVVTQGSPMLVIETNDGLQSIKSPVSGRVLNFNTKARNFPDRLTEDDIILTIVPKSIVVPQTKRVKAVSVPVAQTLEETAEQFRNFNFTPNMIEELNRIENLHRGVL